MPTPLLATKFHPPQLRPELVARSALLERLNVGLWGDDRFLRRLTLVSASAGYGKTTLLAEWLKRIDRPFVWLTLDEGDNDPARFLAYLIASLQGVDAAIGVGTEALLQALQPPPTENLLTSLINEIAAVVTPFTLVLDDYHTIHTLAIHRQLSFFLEHQPSQMHLVLATRGDPPLPLARLRAGGQVLEVRQADLRFSSQETAEFFRRTVGLDLPAADIAVLERRTEGWVAGLQLAALSMHQHGDVHGFVQSFAGSDRYILDYLFEEVIGQQTAEVQDFLLKTSILDQMSGPLCDAVVGRSGSGELLQALEQANLFIMPLDPARTWYRYHRLFGELLRHRLRLLGEPPLSVLHRRASEWYEAEDYAAEAIQHALKAGAWERAAVLIGDSADAMLRRSQVTTLAGWLRALPDAVLRAQPDLCLDYGWALILTGELDQAESYLETAEQAAEEDATTQGNILVMRAYLARARGDYRQAIELSQHVLRAFPDMPVQQRSILALSVGMAQVARGEFGQAKEAFTEAHQAARACRNHYAELTALGLLAAMDAAEGKLHRAADKSRQVLESGGALPATATAYAVLGGLLYEWNDLEEAQTHLQRGIKLCQISGNRDIQVDCQATLAKVQLAAGDLATARATLDNAQQLAGGQGVIPAAWAKIAAVRMAIALAQEDMAAAEHWAARAAEIPDASLVHSRLGLAWATLLLAQGRRASARAALEPLLEHAGASGLNYVVVDIRTLQALAAEDLDQGLAFLRFALILAEPEGYVRTFLDKGEAMANLLRAAMARGIAASYASKLLSLFQADRPVGELQRVSASATTELIEPLSERELQVLRLVAAGLTNGEIAQRLTISIGTVKSHVHHIFGKLEVRSRVEAAARARELDLL